MDKEKQKTQEEMDKEADYFAMCLLMPEASFRREWAILRAQGFKGVDRIFALADIFRLELMLIAKRAQSLGLYLCW